MQTNFPENNKKNVLSIENHLQKHLSGMFAIKSNIIWKLFDLSSFIYSDTT